MGTQELSPDQVRELSKALNQFIFTALKVDEFKVKEREMIEELKSGYESKGKTPSQRIRSVLFLLWEQDRQGYDTFDAYYVHKTEQYIDHLKSKLD